MQQPKPLVMKFGGSSVGTPEGIQNVVEIIENTQKETNSNLWVVFSAFGKVRDEKGQLIQAGTTDMLIEAAEKAAEGDDTYQEVFENIKRRHLEVVQQLFEIEQQDPVMQEVQRLCNALEEQLLACKIVTSIIPLVLDEILSFGERLSAYIISQYLNQKGQKAEFLDARAVIHTDSDYGNAKVDAIKTHQSIKEYAQESQHIQIITGFIASNSQGKTTTLGRGGSDYTASIFGAALSASAIEIWTDVDGVMTADPRVAKKAYSLSHMSYSEAMELAGFGAKVIYPPTMVPAREANIPLVIKNTMNPSFPGTTIKSVSENENGPVKGVCALEDVSMITISGAGLKGTKGFLSRVSKTLADNGVNISLVSQACSENTISLTVDPKDEDKAKESLEKAFQIEMQKGNVDPIEVESNLSVVAIVGENMRDQKGVAARFFTTLSNNGINHKAFTQGSSQRNISTVIEKTQLQKAINALHDEFFVSGKTLNLYIVGTGQVGATLIRQINERPEDDLELKIVGVANSRSMTFNTAGINLQSDEDGVSVLDSEGSETYATNPQQLLEIIRAHNLANAILVDVTSNQKIAELTPELLDEHVHAVAANKKTRSSSMELYNRTEKSLQAGATFEDETTVGAGLPVLKTIRGKIDAGAKVLGVSAMPSGTLGWLFSEYDGTKPFSQLVKEAKEAGITEPLPWEDLNGMDVARKMLILARTSGLELNMEDVQLSGLIDGDYSSKQDLERFWRDLEQKDDEFLELYKQANAEGKVLRFLGELKEGKLSVGLQKVDQDHPAYNLKGTNNIFIITTDRYSKAPMVISGPGAGKEVTAEGVLEGIVSIGRNQH